MKVACPNCKGTNFTEGDNDFQLTSGWYPHVKCNHCGQVLWVAQHNHFAEHGYCGSPTEHWREKKTTLEKLQEQAHQKVEFKNDIPF